MKKILSIAFAALLATSSFAQKSETLLERNQLAKTPPMGWMTWNLFKGDISEQLIKETADAMVEHGFRDAGYEYIFIDDLWQGGRDRHNNIIPDPKKFPNGIKALADYVHSKGLKLGIYSDAAQLTCGGWTASYGFEEQDARTFASWGIDYLKYDYCNAPEDSATARKRYHAMAQALSNDLRKLSAEDKRILLNKEIIAIDQDPLGKAAERKVNQADHQIYVRPLANGSHAVAILNCGDKDKSIQADFKQLGLNGKYLVRDVWQHRDIAKKANRWKGTVKAHETKVFVLK
jgi:hypothetical protein